MSRWTSTLIGHVNPYHVGGDYGITAGCWGTEIARPGQPGGRGPDPAPACDRGGSGPERSAGACAATSNWQHPSTRRMIAAILRLALDYEQFWLRFSDGRESRQGYPEPWRGPPDATRSSSTCLLKRRTGRLKNRWRPSCRISRAGCSRTALISSCSMWSFSPTGSRSRRR